MADDYEEYQDEPEEPEEEQNEDWGDPTERYEDVVEGRRYNVRYYGGDRYQWDDMGEWGLPNELGQLAQQGKDYAGDYLGQYSAGPQYAAPQMELGANPNFTGYNSQYPKPQQAMSPFQEWARDFEQQHGRAAAEKDWDDKQWMDRFVANTGRLPTREEWVKNWYSKPRAQRNYAPEFTPIPNIGGKGGWDVKTGAPLPWEAGEDRWKAFERTGLEGQRMSPEERERYNMSMRLIGSSTDWSEWKERSDAILDYLRRNTPAEPEAKTPAAREPAPGTVRGRGRGVGTPIAGAGTLREMDLEQAVDWNAPRYAQPGAGRVYAPGGRPAAAAPGAPGARLNPALAGPAGPGPVGGPPSAWGTPLPGAPSASPGSFPNPLQGLSPEVVQGLSTAALIAAASNPVTAPFVLLELARRGVTYIYDEFGRPEPNPATSGGPGAYQGVTPVATPPWSARGPQWRTQVPGPGLTPPTPAPNPYGSGGVRPSRRILPPSGFGQLPRYADQVNPWDDQRQLTPQQRLELYQP